MTKKNVPFFSPAKVPHSFNPPIIFKIFFSFLYPFLSTEEQSEYENRSFEHKDKRGEKQGLEKRNVFSSHCYRINQI